MGDGETVFVYNAAVGSSQGRQSGREDGYKVQKSKDKLTLKSTSCNP